MPRRWLLIGGVAVAGLLLCAVLAFFLAFGRIGEWAVRSRVLPKVADRLDREVEVGGIEVKRGTVVLTDVVVRGPADGDEPLARIPRIVADFKFWRAIRGDLVIERVVLDGARAEVVIDANGDDNVRDLLDRLRSGDGEGEGEGRGPRIRPEVVSLAGGHITVRDAARGATVVAEDVTAAIDDGGVARIDIGDIAALTRYGPYTSLEGVALTFDLSDPVTTAAVEIGGGEAMLWQGMSLTGIAGTVARGDEAGQLRIDLAGGYGGVEGTLWRASGWVDRRGDAGQIELKADRFTFDRIQKVLEQSPYILDFEDTSLDVEVAIELSEERVELKGEIGLAGLNLHHPMAAEKPLRGIEFTGSLDAFYDRRAEVVGVREAALQSGGVEYKVDLTVMLPGGVVAETGEPRQHPRVRGRLVVPPVACQQVLESIPAGFVPHLQGFDLRGTFGTDLRVDIDWADLDATQLDGSVGIFGCKVKTAPPAFAASRLKGSFEHRIALVDGEFETIILGEKNPDFVPLAEVSPYVVRSFMTTEDSRFYNHKGFINAEFRTALISDLKAGYFRHGASSITMQMVKNVFLHREKTLSRKLQELFLTWYVETQIDKDRIMEIYVNAIEYGPNLYGIKPAAETYFGKHPRHLNPVEAAFFSSILPSPKRRFQQFCTDKLTRWTERKIERIIELMYKRGRLTEYEYLMARETPLIFNSDKPAICKRTGRRSQR